MRTIKTMLVICEGQTRTIRTNFIQVRSTIGLPLVGEPITAVEMVSGEEHPGKVIEVDRERYGYIAEVRV